MHGRQKVSALRQAQPAENPTGLDFWIEVLEHLEDWVSDHKDAFAPNALRHQIGRTAVSVGEQNVAAVVNDAPVDLLRHTVVIAAVAGLEVIDGNSATRGNHGRQA